MWGLTLQFLLGLFVLRTNVGQQTFSFLGKQVEHFLSHVIAGVEFVFGENYVDFEFAFKVDFFFFESLLKKYKHYTIGLFDKWYCRGCPHKNTREYFNSKLL